MTLTKFIPKTLIFCCLSSSAFGLEIDDFTQQKHERFKDDATFIGSNFDLSGIGRDQSGRWATLISPTVFISAAHFAPSGTVSFYSDNDPIKSAVNRNIVSGQSVGGTDLYIGCLDSPVASNIQHYSFATSLAGLSSAITGYQAGIPNVDKSVDSGFPNTLNMVLGQNKLDSHRVPTFSGITADTIWTAKEATGNTKYINSESLVQSGDSGSPLFIVDGSNNITLLGTAWYKGLLVSPTQGNREASVYTFTGAHTAEINSYIATHVPEPSSTLLFGMTLVFSAFVRKRH